MAKFIFVTGGVVSGLGKGISAASLGMLLKSRGLKVTAQKIDPYMNIDPGTMNPLQHGEVFVTDDGAEGDLDLGHYERFIDVNLNKYSNLTSGKVYWKILNKERNGEFLGETVQVIPHVTNEIKRFIYASAKSTKADVVITEVGGTAGDIESRPILEAIRQIALEKGRNNCLFTHVTLVPFLQGSNEYKSKPTQHSVKELQTLGITPDVIICRADGCIGESIRKKIALFCNVKYDCVIENLTVPSLYEAPLMLHEQGLDKVVCRHLRLKTHEPDLDEWRRLICKINEREKSVKISIVGKYVQLYDAYLSIIESLSHASFYLGSKININWVDSRELTQENLHLLADSDGILIPGGFGNNGIEGKILAAQYAREHNIPFFGICLGMQIAVIEYARNVLKYKDAHSSEFAPKSKHKVIDLMPDQHGVIKGGTMRLGCYPCKITPDTLMHKCYKQDEVQERHRHRYEFNNDFLEQLESAGMTVSGRSPDGCIVETIEVQGHPFYLGVQFHPEFKSRPTRPHPLFYGFVSAALKKAEQ